MIVYNYLISTPSPMSAEDFRTHLSAVFLGPNMPTNASGEFLEQRGPTAFLIRIMFQDRLSRGQAAAACTSMIKHKEWHIAQFSDQTDEYLVLKDKAEAQAEAKRKEVGGRNAQVLKALGF